MFSKESIQELSKAQAIDAAFNAVDRATTERSHGAIALPHDFVVADLEKFLPNRRRLRGTMSTSNAQHFAGYVTDNKEAGAAIFIDQENMRASAVLNLGTPDEPGHADNIANLEPKITAAYAALRFVAGGKALSQKDVAEFLEDWIGFVECLKDGEAIPTTKGIAAIRKITIEALRKLESEEKQLSASKSAFESVSATSSEPLPTIIIFRCQPYSDLQERSFALRLSILTSEKPCISLRIIKIEEHEEQMAKELALVIGDSFAEAPMPIMLGKYSCKA